MKNGLVTLQEVKGGLSVSFADKDAWISMLIGTGTQTILDYIKSDGEEFMDSAGVFLPYMVPDILKTATIIYVGFMMDNPEYKPAIAGDLPDPVVSLLASYWKPIVA